MAVRAGLGRQDAAPGVSKAGAAVVEVAVGVVFDARGDVLLTQRPAGKPMAGYWEFPGGKLEAGESVAQALARELKEELALDIESVEPWVVREFVYPHAHVRLHFCRVRRFGGIPVPLEGQGIRWERPGQWAVEPWLPGALPLKRWLCLPEWYALSDVARLGEEQFFERLEARCRAGLRLLQLREPTLAPDRFLQVFEETRARAHAHGVVLLVNSVHPAAFWQAADGVHLTEATLLQTAVRPAVNWVGASVHSKASLAHAAALDLDFAVLGAVRETASHPGQPALGWDGFRGIAAESPLPLYAIGGLTGHDRVRARAAGAQGIAAIRASWEEDREEDQEAD